MALILRLQSDICLCSWLSYNCVLKFVVPSGIFLIFFPQLLAVRMHYLVAFRRNHDHFRENLFRPRKFLANFCYPFLHWAGLLLRVILCDVCVLASFQFQITFFKLLIYLFECDILFLIMSSVLCINMVFIFQLSQGKIFHQKNNSLSRSLRLNTLLQVR